MQEDEETHLTAVGRAFATPAWTCDGAGDSQPQLETVWEFARIWHPETQFPPRPVVAPRPSLSNRIRSNPDEPQKPLLRFPLFPWLYDLRLKAEEKLKSTVDKGKSPFSLLRTCAPFYQIWEDPWTEGPPDLNRDFQRFSGREPPSRSSLRLSMEEVLKLEKLLQGQQSCLSFGLWNLSSIFHELESLNLDPHKGSKVDRAIVSLIKSLEELMGISLDLSSFFVLARRLFFAPEFPRSVLPEERTDLLRSPLGGRTLFDKDLITSFTANVRADAAAEKDVAITKHLMSDKKSPPANPPRRRPFKWRSAKLSNKKFFSKKPRSKGRAKASGKRLRRSRKPRRSASRKSASASTSSKPPAKSPFRK